MGKTMNDLPFRFAEARILVIDDSEFSRKLIFTALKKQGYARIEQACDGMEGLEKTRRFTPDMVILDLNMPRLDGFTYCERVRAEKDMARMPIIVQTAIDEHDAKLLALSCGADDFLHKPFDPEELRLRMNIHLEKHFLTQSLSAMCECLAMELEQTRAMLKELERMQAPGKVVNMMNRHREVLETVTLVSGKTSG